MRERMEVGLGAVGVAAVLGLLGSDFLRVTPWVVNVFLFALAFLGFAAALACWRGVSFDGEGRSLVAPLVLFAALLVWRDFDTLAVVNGLSLVVALSLAAMRGSSGRMSAGLSEYLYWCVQAAICAYARPIPPRVRTDPGRVEWGKELKAPYLVSPSTDAVPPFIAALPRLPEADRRPAETGLRTRWANSAPADSCTYDLFRSRAQAKDPRGYG